MSKIETIITKSADSGAAIFDGDGQLITCSADFHQITKNWLNYNDKELSLFSIFPQNSDFSIGDFLLKPVVIEIPVNKKIRYSASRLLNGHTTVSCENYTHHLREKDIQIGRGRILRLAAEGKPLDELMMSLVLASESANPGILCSLLMVEDDTQRLRECAAPNLPKPWRDMVDGMRIGAQVGSCGHAAYTGEDVFAEDIQEHPYWQRVKNLSKEVGLRSCWSTPVLDNRNQIVATFAMYTNQVNFPDEWEVSFMHTTAQLAGIIIQQRNTEDRALELAELDDLTGLMNRKRFITYLGKTLHNFKQEPVYLYFLDLDQFKNVNDTLGHVIGDELLKETTQRIQNVLGEHAILGRVGGDEFAFFLKGEHHKSKVYQKAEEVLSAIKSPFSIKGNDIHIGGSIGIAEAPIHGTDPEKLIGAADIAMSASKDSGRNLLQYYDSNMLIKIQREEIIRNKLEEAILLRQGISLVFQSQVDATSGKIVSCEALCRWHDAELGNISPIEFITVAEKKGLINRLGELIIELAVSQMVTWRDQFQFVLPMAINFSATQFKDTDLISNFLSLIRYNKLDTKLFECEVTESTLIDDIQIAIDSMTRLNDAGVGIAIDDFGTGYSSLSYLNLLPFQKLKIDRSFVKDICNDKQCAKIASAVTSLGLNLGLKVVAEGIEHKEQADFLSQKQCDYFQGFFFSKPLTGRQFADYFLEHNKTTTTFNNFSI